MLDYVRSFNDRMLLAWRVPFCNYCIQGAFECRIMVHLGLSADGSLVSSHVAHDLLKCSEKLNVAASTGWPGGMAPGIYLQLYQAPEDLLQGSMYYMRL